MAVIGHVLSYECTSVVYEMRIMVGLDPVKVRGSLVAVSHVSCIYHLGRSYGMNVVLLICL